MNQPSESGGNRRSAVPAEPSPDGAPCSGAFDPGAVGPGHGAAGVPPLDLGHLDRQTGGDRTLADELLALMAGQIVRFRGRTQAASGEDRRQIAHAIGGAARAVGARPLAEAAGAFEAAPQDEALRQAFDAALDRLGAALRERETEGSAGSGGPGCG